jgi:hypothetical protein
MGYQTKLHEGNRPQLWLADGIYNAITTSISSFFDVLTWTWNAGAVPPTTAVYRTSLAKLDNELYLVGGSTAGFSYTGLADRHSQCMAPTPMWVENINMTYVPRQRVYGVKASFRILELFHDPVDGALVYVQWTLPDGTVILREGFTSMRGQLMLSIRSPQTGAYHVCVTDVQKAGNVYDSGRNKETCDTIMVP